MKILFIGILTEDVLASTRSEGLIGTLVDIEEAAAEVGKICDAYRTTDIDFTVLLTHIGFEADKRLAAELDPAWGVDIIIGGHSHTYLEEPCEVAGIPIVQAAIGTDQIGRFDIMVDTDNNCIDSYTWKLIPVTPENCPVDHEIENIINKYKRVTDEKYSRILTRFPRTYTHPRRNMETELGDIFAECIREQLNIDLVLIASGSIRKPKLGPVVTLKDYMEIFPFTDPIDSFVLTGAQLRHMAAFLLRDASFEDSEHNEWYQFSRGYCCEYDKPSHTIISLKMNGKEVEDDDRFTVGMQHYHYLGMQDFLDLSLEEVHKNALPRVLATQAKNVLQEYFIAHDTVKLDGDVRLIIHE